MNVINLTVDDSHAEALAQFCKRSFLDRVRIFSASETEARQMVDAIHELRNALAEAGFAPR
ncbi:MULTISPECIES: DUF7706 family protein [unclassified Rhizobium]|uniref:DUF7706 family protein n=1 Tax=unclassified Rhizobium TaxID=2613769 RepID=UPI0007E92CBE|nr:MULTISPECIES: hypothetical protein [unclassified Rhizobium]ANK89647.1 hypothetical protein AMK01_CH00118 [Rhizobium sp. N6212]ANK95674.1 hypothetical protein AMK00_CH00118 [Rhizobium sp. N621]